MKNYSLFLILTLTIFACSLNKDPQEIVDKSIEAHGVKNFENRTVTFDFRDKQYLVKREQDKYTYIRSFEHDSLGRVKDVLLNSTDLVRYVNDTVANISDEWKFKYANSVNSVLYFFQLPYGLNDPAVIKEYLGQKVINGTLYEKIKVTFQKENGGKDFEDEYVYWINSKTNTIDFFAYSYLTDGGGKRFRQAINRRKIKGILFQDYINFEPANVNTKVEDLDVAFIEASLIELSQISSLNINVQ